MGMIQFSNCICTFYMYISTTRQGIPQSLIYQSSVVSVGTKIKQWECVCVCVGGGTNQSMGSLLWFNLAIQAPRAIKNTRIVEHLSCDVLRRGNRSYGYTYNFIPPYCSHCSRCSLKTNKLISGLVYPKQLIVRLKWMTCGHTPTRLEGLCVCVLDGF